ncbi:hypothetical protein [Bacillus sp. es.034]|uniref:hypothetical protein n=1 Tax=Bacillus sp. es.034 TaxID=1761763 RepID=UPI000BF90D72|nr:hypothetical protein [Bacillus sp. es.034]PFG04449.1 hypothetical protein ATG71_1193 [Bacillus sp. es.034]
MPTTKEKSRNLFRLLLLIYPIFMGIMGTISLIVLVTWGIPQEDLQSQMPAILLLALVIYGTCAASILIRSIFFKKEKISQE